jgi:hypothetical protein
MAEVSIGVSPQREGAELSHQLQLNHLLTTTKRNYHIRSRRQATYAASDPAFTFSKASFD